MDQQTTSDPRLQALFEEYRALYALLVLRLTAMEQRLPLVAAALSIFLGGGAVLPEPVRPLVFLTTPLALVWLVRTTAGHARSKEDVKIRLDEIEHRVNALVGEEVMVFQSRHPSRGRVVAGRSGQELMLSVYGMSMALLAACVLLSGFAGFSRWTLVFFAAIAAASGLLMTIELARLGRYRAMRTPDHPNP